MKKQIRVAIIGLSGESIFLEVDEFHKPGETIKAKSIHIEPGGKGYNQAACLLKLGAKVAYLTTVGYDKFAQDCYDYLDQKNACLYFNKIADNKTALATIITNKYGKNQVTVFPGASNLISEKQIDEFSKEIKNSDILLLTLELPLKIVEQAIRIAKESNVFVVLNPAPYNKGFKLYSLCDVIIPNEVEALDLFGFTSIDEINENSIREYLCGDLKNIIITLGGKGCLLIQNIEGRIEFHKVNGILVDTVDTTGAGDVFNASFVYFYKTTGDIKQAIEYANLAAAISTTKKYVLNSLPSLDDINTYNKI